MILNIGSHHNNGKPWVEVILGRLVIRLNSPYTRYLFAIRIRRWHGYERRQPGHRG